jgi:starch synthase
MTLPKPIADPEATAIIGAPLAADGADASPSPLLARGGRPAAVVHLAAELSPYARTGGLGEAVASLARYQASSGIPTTVMMPLYRAARETAGELRPLGPAFDVEVGSRVEEARLYTPVVPGATGARVIFVENERYFDRAGIYGESGWDYIDNARRYAFFALAALTALPRIAPAPLVLHSHDWHTALAPVYLRNLFPTHPYYRQVASVLSVHNAGYQGHFLPETLPDIGLSMDLFNWREMEWFDRVNLLKGGLIFADAVTTVSSTHAHELRTAAGGFGLHGVFIGLRDRLIGIVNGIDQQLWDPASDPQIPSNYSRDDVTGKRVCRARLQDTLGLQRRARIPIFAMTARLVSQKGLDLILGDPGYFALDAQYIFLGSGEPHYEEALTEIASRAPRRISVELRFTDALEHLLLAGADMCLMPSQYEPCGLTQMRAQRYGTIPVARRVGGLADTIEDGVTGFLFDDYTTEDFMLAATRAVEQYLDPRGWRTMMREAMSRDFGWEQSEARYLQVYQRVLGLAEVASQRARVAT